MSARLDPMSGRLSDRPVIDRRRRLRYAPPVSVIDDVLSATSVETTVFGRIALPSTWGISFPPGPKAAFHVVDSGEAWLTESSLEAPRRLTQGHVVLLARGTGHALCSRPGVPLQSLPDFLAELPRTMAAQEAQTAILCGAYRIRDSMRHPLLSLLPPVVHVDTAEHPTLRALLTLMEAERTAHGFGAESTRAKLVDIMFIHLIRVWLDRQPTAPGTWLEATRDPRIADVLRAIHGRPALPWTLNDLAKLASMSRAAFVRRFRALTGEAPLTYLARWRMAQAERMLRDTSLSVSEIATRVGYGSEFAFSKAFRRTRGVAPANYRKSAAA
jgi:AraC-like DNA-binding protein